MVLVGEWLLEEGEGNIINDTSGYNNHGSIHGAAWASGVKGGNALSFEGIDDYTEIPHSHSLDLTTNFTISACVYPRAYHWDYLVFVGKAIDCGFQQWKISLLANEPKWCFSWWYGGTTADWEECIGGDISLNEWHHLIATISDTHIKTYMAGELTAEHEIIHPILGYEEPVYFGAAYPTCWFTDVALANIRIYDHVLSDAEAVTLYQQDFCAEPISLFTHNANQCI